MLRHTLPILLLTASLLPAAVPTSEITLNPVVTDNLPVFTSLTAYNYPNDSDALSVVLGGATVSYDPPLYYPFDTDLNPWWDNLVAELSQARLPVVMFATRGSTSTDPASITGGLNPRQLTRMIDALGRANATGLFKLACFVDSPAMRDINQSIYGLPSGTKMDFANTTAWNDVVWLRTVKPWFDTVPQQYWYKINNRPVIQWWSIASAWFINQNGNAKRMLQFVSDSFNAAYGVRPLFILDAPWGTSLDPSSLELEEVLGLNKWFGPPTTPYTYLTLDSFTAGTAVPGFINPNYFNPTHANYQNPNQIIPRNKVDGTGTNGDTLIAGMDAAVTANAHFTVLEGFNDVREWAGFYRCASSRFTSPNQYINIIRQYTDLRTVTLRLEAEAADQFSDTTSGNSAGQVYRRNGDLDVRALSSGTGWTVTNTAAGEWIQFNKVYFSPGNYKFPIRYSAASAGKRVRLYLDGASLGDVSLPATSDANTFDTISLGQKTVSWGLHTLKVQFLDGAVDLDWLFVRKYDPMISLQAAGSYVCAELGGNSSLVANRPGIGSWEKFSADDLNGGSLSANDPINLQSHNGLLVSAEGGGGGTLSVNRRRAGGWEQFTIVKTNGGSGALVNGDSVALRSQTGRYITVGSGNILNVSGTTIGAAQTFIVTLSAQ